MPRQVSHLVRTVRHSDGLFVMELTPQMRCVPARTTGREEENGIPLPHFDSTISLDNVWRATTLPMLLKLETEIYFLDR